MRLFLFYTYNMENLPLHEGKTMKEKIDQLKNELFGKAWNEITEIMPGMGSIIIDYETRQMCLDESSKRLLGITGKPDFDSVVRALEVLCAMNEMETPIRISKIDAPMGYVAAVLYTAAESKKTGDDGLSNLVDEKRLLERIELHESGCMLALMSIENTGSERNTDAARKNAIQVISKIIGTSGLIASYKKNQYWLYVPMSEQNETEAVKVCESIRAAVRENARKKKSRTGKADIDVCIGVSISNHYTAERMNEAGIALCEAMRHDENRIYIYDQSDLGEIKEEYKEIELLMRIINEKLIYHVYQPIVNAHTGEIVGYEALMRTDASIGLSPLQILDMAAKYGRLYDIEKITFKNSLEYMKKNQLLFINRRMYVNSIPSHCIKYNEWIELRSEYGELMEKLVVEMTEQTELSDADLDDIKNRIKEMRGQMAIDDYGTGYSNVANLLRYNPMIVKIDRSLITGIDTDQKMQKIVTGIIESLHNCGYVALAEGIETGEELKYLIEAGADRIQGFYLARPDKEAIYEIQETTRDEIKRYNSELSGEIVRIYHPRENESVRLEYLASQKYTLILVDTKNVSITGDEHTKPASLAISVKENTDCTISIKDLKLVSTNAEPTFKIGAGSHVTLILEGNNSFERKGILVPGNSSLSIEGSGNLSINSEMKDCYAIGNDSKHSAGNIKVDITGILDINVSGDVFAGIGGGWVEEGGSIDILGGLINIAATGVRGVGIGCTRGCTNLNIGNCDISVDISSSRAVLLGAVSERLNLNMTNVYFKAVGNGAEQTGIGIVSGGNGNIRIKNCFLDMEMKAENLVFVGSFGSSIDIDTVNSRIYSKGEGANITVLGDRDGDVSVYIKDTEIKKSVTSENLFEIGDRNGNYVSENCVIS